MSPQTDRTIKHEDRRAHSVTRAPARAGSVMRHEMTVVGSSVGDVVASAGGWLYDRRTAGWRVNVHVRDRDGERALQILGAEVLDVDAELEAITDDPAHVATLVVAADVYATDERVRRLVARSDRSRAEVALWGDTAPVGPQVSAVSYRLSAAARAFKSQALLAAGISSAPVAATEALYRCGVTPLAPVAVRS